MFTELKSALTQLGHKMSDGGTLNGTDQQNLRNFHFFEGKNPFEAAYEYAFDAEKAIASDLKIALVKLGLESADELPEAPVVDTPVETDKTTDSAAPVETDTTTNTDTPVIETTTDTSDTTLADETADATTVVGSSTTDTPVIETTTDTSAAISTEDTDTEVQ